MSQPIYLSAKRMYFTRLRYTVSVNVLVLLLFVPARVEGSQSVQDTACSYVLMTGQVDGYWRMTLFDVPGQRSRYLTGGGGNERDAVWSPDGRQIAFAANYDTNWDIYIYDVISGDTRRFTESPAYDGNPVWSPDGQLMLFESARDGQIELYIASIDGDEIRRLTDNQRPDVEPLWMADNEHIIYSSWRDGVRSLYLQHISDGEVVRLTMDGEEPQQPSLSPDGRLLMYIRDLPGQREMVLYDLGARTVQTVREHYNGVWPQIIEQSDQTQIFMLEPRIVDGAVYPDAWTLIAQDMTTARSTTFLRLQGQWRQPRCGRGSLLPPALPWQPLSELNAYQLWSETSPKGTYHLQTLDGVKAQQPRLSSAVADSFNRLRYQVRAASGFDYLGKLNDAWRGLDHPGGELLSWHKTGRAFDALDWFAPDRQRLYLARQTIGGYTYFRIYLLARQQDGSQGLPLRESLWETEGRLANPDLLAQGGRSAVPPAGYFVDFTDLAEQEHWMRIPALTPPNGDWRHFYADMEFWHYEKRGKLTWYEAMKQLYSEDQIGQRYSHQRLLARKYTQERLIMAGIENPVDMMLNCSNKRVISLYPLC